MAAFYNQASLTYRGETVVSNVAAGELLEVLTVTKTALPEEYTQGENVTYAINIVNSGATPYTGLTVTDDLGAYTFGAQTLTPLDYVENSIRYFSDGVLQPTPAVTSGPPLTVTGITVPANGTATLLYTTSVNVYAPPAEAGTITNTVTVSGGTDITATETITAAAAPVLEIVKSVSPTTVMDNGQLTYTFVIQNTGNTAATVTDAVVLNDLFDPVLTGLTVTYNGVEWTDGTEYSYDEVSGEFSTVSGEITVPAATFSQNADTGVWTVTPGMATVTVTGTV